MCSCDPCLNHNVLLITLRLKCCWGTATHFAAQKPNGKIIDYLDCNDRMQTQYINFNYGYKQGPVKGLIDEGLNQWRMTHWS